MSVAHRLTGYDRRTERLEIAHGVPRAKEPFALEVAGVARDRDPGAVGVYPLLPEQARRIAAAIGARINTESYDWFLEPAAAMAE